MDNEPILYHMSREQHYVLWHRPTGFYLAPSEVGAFDVTKQIERAARLTKTQVKELTQPSATAPFHDHEVFKVERVTSVTVIDD